MGMHQASVLSPFPFVVVVDVVIEFAREAALSDLLYADDLVITSCHTDGMSKIKFLSHVGSAA